MTTPINEIVQWYESLPISHRQDIAAILGSSMPGFGSLDSRDIENLPDSFVKTIRSHQTGPFAEVGLALSLRECIEFFFINKRSSRADWQRTETMLKTLAAESGSETFASSAQQVEFRREQWIKTCEKWKELRVRWLTNEILDAWCAPSA